MSSRAFRYAFLLALIAAMSLVGFVFPGPAHANGAPVDIFLSYLPGVSNWGSQSASGEAVVAVGEGSVDLEVQGLPRLQNEHYEVWLESREERRLYSAGTFNVAADGVGQLHVLLNALPYQEYRTLIISVEPEPDPSPEPDGRTALAGLFPNPAIVQVTGEISGTATVVTPSYLPITGAPAPVRPLLPLGPALFAACGMLAALTTRKVLR